MNRGRNHSRFFLQDEESREVTQSRKLVGEQESLMNRAEVPEVALTVRKVVMIRRA